MVKQYLGGLFKTVSGASLVLTGIVLLILSGCEKEPVLSGEKDIIEFKIDNKRGAINQTDKTISVVVDATTNLTSLTPELIISSDASVYPGSLVLVDISSPISYTVTAEDGTSQSYQVTVRYPANATVLDSLAIKVPPFKTVYELYESFDPSGLVIIGFYSDGSSKEENQYALSEPDTTTEGTKTVEITIGSKTTSFNINVRSGRLESIAISKLPDTTTYAYGMEALDTTGLVVTGIYSDGSTESVESPVVSGFNSSKAGIQEILVSVNGKTAAFAITVLPPKVLESITISKLPDTTTYAYGMEDLDTTGLVVTGIYSDGTTESVESPAVSGFNGSRVGSQEILVSVNGKTAAFAVTVLPPKVLESIMISKLPDTATYAYETEALDTTGLVVTGIYSDGTTESVESPVVSGFNSSRVGSQEILVSVNGKTAVFAVTVLPPKVLESITIVERPAKVLYIPEEKGDFDELERLYDDLLNGLIVTGTYSDGSTAREELTQENISGFNPEKSGPQTLRITVGDQAVTFIVDIVKLDYIETAVIGKTLYLVNEAIDLSGFVIIGHYSDATTRREIITDANISGFDSSKIGAGQEVTVTVGRQKAYFSVNVYEETSLTINLASDLHIEVYGLPEVTQENPDQTIFLSLGRRNGLSDMVVISTTSNFESIKWTIDNKNYSTTNNIIAISAEDYTFGVHVIGFIGKRGQAEYSRTLKLNITY
jgi:hypothetical protein